MTATELHEIESLLEKALPDPMGFLERVAEQLINRLAVNTPAPPGAAETVLITDLDAPANQLWEDQSIVLAAALGACECWGQDPECEDCSGAGAPGWVEPDAQLYAEYVEPAARRLPVSRRQPQDSEKGEARD